jgi:hypothetical protein
MYSGIEVFGTIGMFLLIRIIVPTGAILFLGDWLKTHQEKVT